MGECHARLRRTLVHMHRLTAFRPSYVTARSRGSGVGWNFRTLTQTLTHTLYVLLYTPVHCVKKPPRVRLNTPSKIAFHQVPSRVHLGHVLTQRRECARARQHFET